MFVRYGLVLLVIAADLVGAQQPPNPLPPSLSPDGAVLAPSGDVTIDAAPANRWDDVVKGVIDRHGFEHSFGPLLATIRPHMAALAPLVQFLRKTIEDRFPDLSSEIHGLSGEIIILGYNTTYEEFIVVNFLTELSHVDLSTLTHPQTGVALDRDLLRPALEAVGMGQGQRACTSIVARAADGTMLHARNADADATHLMRNLTVDLTWRANGIVVARSVQFAGFVGIHTGMSVSCTPLCTGFASLTSDQRLYHTYSVQEWMDIVSATSDAGPGGFKYRAALIENRPASFSDVLSDVQATPLASSAYVILSGSSPSDGAIVTRNFTTQNTLMLDDAHTTKYQSLPWVLIQTNSDYNKPEPSNDPRRATAGKLLAAMGQTSGASIQGLLNVLSTESKGPRNASAPGATNGLLNVGTAFTSVVMPYNVTFGAYLRDSHGCCS